MNTILNQLVPELSVFNLEKSLNFYVNILGFSICYQREEEGFAFLMLDDVQIMLDQIYLGRTWQTGRLDYPLGRGVSFQIKIKNMMSLLNKLKQHNVDLFLELEECWYRKDTCEVGQKQFIVMDPDGYLLRFAEDLGVRELNTL